MTKVRYKNGIGKCLLHNDANALDPTTNNPSNRKINLHVAFKTKHRFFLASEKYKQALKAHNTTLCALYF